MKNAHLRLAKVKYESTATHVYVWCDRFAADGSNGQLLSVFGNDSEMSAIYAAIAEGRDLLAKLPDGSEHKLDMGKKALSYRANINIPGRQRPVQHMLFMAESLTLNGTGGNVMVLQNDDELIWTSVVSSLGLPAAPEWGSAAIQMLRTEGMLQEIDGFNLSPVKVSASRDFLMQWIGDHVKTGKLKLPEADGPIHWPTYTIEDIFRMDAKALEVEGEYEEEALIAA